MTEKFKYAIEMCGEIDGDYDADEIADDGSDAGAEGEDREVDGESYEAEDS